MLIPNDACFTKVPLYSWNLSYLGKNDCLKSENEANVNLGEEWVRPGDEASEKDIWYPGMHDCPFDHGCYPAVTLRPTVPITESTAA